jgi:ATP-dependent Clp protease ATP-binding subunit ClpC
MVKLSAGVDVAWQIAASETAREKHQYIERELVLISICSLDKVMNPDILKKLDPCIIPSLKSENDEITDLLRKFGLEQKSIRRALRAQIGKGNYLHEENVIHRSESCKEYFDTAIIIASQQGSDEICCLDLLAAIMEKPGSHIDEVLKEFNVKAEDIKKSAFRKIETKKIKDNEPPKSGFLERYGTDLTKLAQAKKIDPLIGRREELLKVINSLLRKKKSNPLIVGESGVGKTAIVRGLAQRIADKKITHSLRNKRLIELSMSSLVAGTNSRGEFEERLTQLINDIKANPDVIVFIDNIETIVGMGNGQANFDASNLLKPALANGDFSCIGITTVSEYHKRFENDASLMRIFQPIMIDEPSAEDTILILDRLKGRYEDHHKVTITDSGIKAAVTLSVEYMPDRRLPDKALDLLDDACSGKKVQELSVYGDIDETAGRVDDEDIRKVIEKMKGIKVIFKKEEPDKEQSIEDIKRRFVIRTVKLLQKSLINNDIDEAYQYATDLCDYTDGEIKTLVHQIVSQVKIRIENDICEIPEEINREVKFLVNKIEMN